MKTAIFTLIICMTTAFVFAQNDTIQKSDTSFYRIVKTDGSDVIGQIIKKDRREVLVMTNDGREIFIPQHVIEEIIPIRKEEYNSNGKFIGEDKFATRYFISTNGLPVKKGEHYVQWNLFGPDFQFGIGDDLGVGVMTSWIGIPLIGTIKKSFQLGEKSQLGLGALVGTGSWALPRFGGALPYATLSFGNRRANIAFSSGYGIVWGEGGSAGRGMLGVAGMAKVAPKISIVFDSFFLLPNQQENRDMVALIIPGIRWHQEEGKAFQFGFAGISFDGNVLPLPIPMVQWYRSL